LVIVQNKKTGCISSQKFIFGRWKAVCTSRDRETERERDRVRKRERKTDTTVDAAVFVTKAALDSTDLNELHV
jgi:hypothetical protein